MKNFFNRAAFFAICAALFFAFASCSNSVGEGGNATPLQKPTIYTITFNANDGSENPARATQTFKPGVSQNLKTITELAFSRAGFNFAGWGTSANSTESSYADGAEYTASANLTFYAIWSAVPVYKVIISSNEHGTVTPSSTTRTAGEEITLSNTPAIGWQFESYTVTAADATSVPVISDKFTMPAQDVTVTANFTMIDYSITINPVINGSVEVTVGTSTAPATTAKYGQTVVVTASPADGYKFASLTLIDSDGTIKSIGGYGNRRTFTMPAKDVAVAATFTGYSVEVNNPFVGGTVTATPASATAGTTVTLEITPSRGWQFEELRFRGFSGDLSGTGNIRTFIMPASDVMVFPTFSRIPYSVNVKPSDNGIVTASHMEATIGESVTLTVAPASDYGFSGLVVTEEDGTLVSLSGTGNTRIFKMPASNVTVTSTFSALPIAAYTKIGTVVGQYPIEGKEFDLVTFGLWPQSIKDKNVTIDENDILTRGEFTYCKGSDGQWYVQGTGNRSDCWFKVEPIKWRILTSDYNGTGKKLLLAENCLMRMRFDERNNIYEESEIRAWLNSNTYRDAATSDHGDSKGFLMNAFTSAQIKAIVSVNVDNSLRSVFPDGDEWYPDGTRFPQGWSDRVLVSADQLDNRPTVDKIFLLSLQEATKMDYGFWTYYAQGVYAKLRAKWPTDFVGDRNYTECWWLRSPHPTTIWVDNVGCVGFEGTFGQTNYDYPRCVVPALCY